MEWVEKVDEVLSAVMEIWGGVEEEEEEEELGIVERERIKVKR